MEQSFLDRLNACHAPRNAADCLLREAQAITGAPMGNVQCMDWAAGSLAIETQVGFGDEFLNFFQKVPLGSGSVCGQALGRREIVSVEDVHANSACLPYGGIFARAGVFAVHSVPLITGADALVGMVSVHFPKRVLLSAAQLAALRHAAMLAASRLVSLSAERQAIATLYSESVTRVRVARDAMVRADRLLERMQASLPGA